MDNDYSAVVLPWISKTTSQELQPLRDDPKLLAEVRSNLTWGTNGSEGSEPTKTLWLDDLETYHLENIIITQYQIKPLYKLVILVILKERYLHTADKRVDEYLDNSTKK
jgi:hypothetical protein